MTEKDVLSKYPDALSIKFGEGGFSFLHRVFRQHIDSGQPVIINTGDLYYRYQYLLGHSTFMEGLTLIEGKDADAELRFRQVVNNFSLDVAISEGGYQKNNEGSLQKKKDLD